MFIKKIWINIIKGKFNAKVQDLPCKDLNDAVDAVKSLDGKVRKEVFLEGENRALQINASKEGRYFVLLVMRDKEKMMILTDPSRPEGKDVKVSGMGNMVQTSLRQSTGLPMALQAVREFAKTGEPDKSLVWDDGLKKQT